MKKKKLNKHIKSYAHAMQGIRFAFDGQFNSWVQLFLGVLAVVLALVLEIRKLELICILICCALVIGLEIMNTAIEKLCDFVHKENHSHIGVIKDLSAGAVLVTSILSFIIALIIFIPYLIRTYPF